MASTKLKVHGVPMSTATMRVLAALAEKGLSYDLLPVNMAQGQHKSEAFLALNPWGQIPVCEDGDLKLFESRAIAQYVAHQYAAQGCPLISSDPKKMAAIAVWCEVEAHQFDPVASKLTFELCIKPLLGRATDPAAAEEHQAKLGKVLDVYEARLSENKYLAGDCFSLADLYHYPCLYYLLKTDVKSVFDARPHVAAWCADIMGRPGWLKVAELQKKP